MKRSLIVFLICIFINFSCTHDSFWETSQASVFKNIISESGDSYLSSLRKWNGMKEKNGDSYSYQTTFTSWTGYGGTTELKVQNGVVTSRKYTVFQIDQTNGDRIFIESYEEDINNLGSNEEGALPRTIDELYESCAKDYLVADQEKNTIYFETTNLGLMSLCGFVPDNCADDCFLGVRINAFNWLSL